MRARQREGRWGVAWIVVASALSACSGDDGRSAGEGSSASSVERGPDGRGGGTIATAPAGNAGTTSPILYHGGPVMSAATTNVYYVWYGNWSTSAAPAILDDFAKNLGGSPYYDILTTYSQGVSPNTVSVQNSLTFVEETYDAYSHGKNLNDSAVFAIVSAAITSGKLRNDAAGTYFVLTSADVNETSGFCRFYCAWHDHGAVNGVDVKYAFIGDPSRCPRACEVQTTGPNGNSGADGMANLVAHELDEMVSDPDLNAWYDKSGQECGDKCAWTFGAESTAGNGALYNVTLGARQYLIQQNWVNANGGYCAMAYP